ncbi:GPI-anchored protein LORELEI-like [Pyrus ussuriensis x Pyrus communis]|uniref:GPI-anchored protein LORELEI-like n=1 Tax=Pyrus ussuriensis x Pyrus communis TaxID=2448454 RepID=A0A5N5GAS0_9ROSA|nr:GPI-anchored protein LORELEI-like [Pyrus ussuriensis x Pyrus communis]
MAFSSHPFFFFFFLVLGFASSTTFLSYDIFESGGSSTGGRALLQAQKNCPVNFENQNYTIITSKCKGPNYPAKSCCDALKDFACPFTNEINDLKNDCASTMFSYINIYGKYPPGFASQCREGKEGLACPAEHRNLIRRTAEVTYQLLTPSC